MAARKGTQIATTQPAATPPAPAVSEGATLLSVIAAAARDPNVDVDKMERLMAMHVQMTDRAAEQAFTQAFVAMHPLLPSIDKKGRLKVYKKGHFGDDNHLLQSSGYAKWEDIQAVITPILAEHGFALSFENGSEAVGQVSVTAILSHIKGHSRRSSLKPPRDDSGSKNGIQGMGSAITYAKRYNAVSVLNIRIEGEDDDGAKSGRVVNHEEHVEVEPRRSGHALRKDGAWQDMMKLIRDDLRDCHTVLGLERLKADYLEKARVANWNEGWRSHLAREFDEERQRMERELSMLSARDEQREAAMMR